MPACRGVRGAITVRTNTAQAILAASQKLLERIIAANGIQPFEICSVIFTVTPDLDRAYPAQAARHMGWTHVPLLCAQEMEVPDGLPRCVRVLLLWNTDRSPERIRHIYLEGARALRPDLSNETF